MRDLVERAMDGNDMPIGKRGGPARARPSVTVNLAESPLCWLRSRALVDPRQFEAGEGLPVAEKALGWPQRAGRIVLTLALDRLGDHYGLG